MRFLEVGLACGRREEALGFYENALGLAVDAAAVRIGETTLRLDGAGGEPFYHFALLVPGDRFHPALSWAEERVVLLRDRDSDDAVFDFPAWSALACYFHDPAGNIVELIAHRGVEASGVEGPFAGTELVGLSELGLVGDTRALAHELDGQLGLTLWDGTLEPGRLAFVGERARTLILAPPGRGWLPTGRPAVPCPADLLLDAGRFHYDAA
jgi:catechol 2,3-dioxygenase-like lactoylglutathione lyase family enzyme